MGFERGKHRRPNVSGAIAVLGLVVPVIAEHDVRNLKIARSPDGAVHLITPLELTVLVSAQVDGSPDPWAAVVEFGSYFGVQNASQELVLTNSETDSLGGLHTTYTQVHQGIPVYSGMLKVHHNAAGDVTAINGDFYSIPVKLNLEPGIDTVVAEMSALVEVNSADAAVFSTELLIVDPGWYGDPSIGARLAYRIVLIDPMAPLNEALFVDAHSGEILDRWSLIHTAKNRVIYDGEEGISLPGTLARAEGQGVTGDFDIDAAYDYYGDTYDYFFRGHGRDSVDGAGLPIVATVHSTSPGCPNAYWSGSLLQMVFCTGTATDDIVGHELTHGLTQFSAGLIYQNQSGQLNEAMSDIFGELIDLFNGDAAFAGTPGGTPWPTHPTGPGSDEPNLLRTSDCSAAPLYKDGYRWLVGEDASVFGGAIRDMWNPPCYGDPDQTDHPFQTCSSGDSGGVHSGSGIANHAFAIMTDGKTFNGTTVAAIGPIKAGAVWYRALTVYMTPATDFDEAYDSINLAAGDLVGTFPNDPRTGLPSDNMFTTFDAAQVDLALLAVEMNVPGNCGESDSVLDDTPSAICADRVTVFSDDFENGENGWTVENSGPLTPYDWVQTGDDLPFGRTGTAWFIDDPDLGDCGAVDESGSHSLFSPPLLIPSSVGVPMISFDHFLAAEGGWDGGNVKISVNGGAWTIVPRSALIHNPYNGRTNSVVQGNTNPFAGEASFTGAGGAWGTTTISLGSLVGNGQTLEIRFDFGKDGCTGVTGWYLDDFELFMCPDCDLDGTSDQAELTFTDASEFLVKIGSRTPQSYTVLSPPEAIEDVTLTFHAAGDFGSASEHVDVKLNNVAVGSVYVNNATDCPQTPDVESLIVPASTFNAAGPGNNVVIDLTATVDVGDENCSGESTIAVSLHYRTTVGDADSDGLPDSCEVSGCPGDANGDAVVDPLDSGYVLARLGCSVGTGNLACDIADQNADSVVDPLDAGFVQARFGQCN